MCFEKREDIGLHYTKKFLCVFQAQGGGLFEPPIFCLPLTRAHVETTAHYQLAPSLPNFVINDREFGKGVTMAGSGASMSNCPRSDHTSGSPDG